MACTEITEGREWGGKSRGRHLAGVRTLATGAARKNTAEIIGLKYSRQLTGGTYHIMGGIVSSTTFWCISLHPISAS